MPFKPGQRQVGGILLSAIALDGVHLLIDGNQGIEGGACRTATHRVVAFERAMAVKVRGDVGQHPVKTVVGDAVLDHAKEFFATLQGLPQQTESAARHVRVTDDAVRMAEQGILPVTANTHEVPVGIGNDPLGVGLGDDQIIIGQHILTLSDQGQRRIHIYRSTCGVEKPAF